MPAGQQARTDSSSRLPKSYLATGCGLLALFVFCIGAIGPLIYFWIYDTQRGPAASQPAVEYILDASPRMALDAEAGADTRLAVAQSVLDEIVRPADPAVTAGLRVFGTGKLADACADTDLLVPLARASQGKISASLLAVNTGSRPDTAMAMAVVAALRDLSSTKGPRTLVVVTGGSDSCSAQAGQLIAAEARKDGIDYQLFVIGYLLTKEQGDAVSGLVDSAGNGHYVNARSKDELTTVLRAIQQYVDNPKAISVAGVLATAAALPTATAVPPTAALVPTATPVPATATPAASPTAAFGLTACDNPYLPLRPGATWTYKFASGQIETWAVAAVNGDTRSAVASLTLFANGLSRTADWECTASGIVKDNAPNLTALLPTIKNFSFKNISGVFLPPAEQLIDGAHWDSNYTIDYDATVNGQLFHYTGTIVEQYKFGANEQVTVGGQTYDALRVDGTTAGDYVSGKQPAGRFVASLRIWFVRGIGMVRHVTTTLPGGLATVGQGSSLDMESYNVP